MEHKVKVLKLSMPAELIKLRACLKFVQSVFYASFIT